jgi:small-conductance mechanosensitive channel
MLHDLNMNFLKTTMLHALKIAVIYLLIGTLLIALSYVDDIFPLLKWKNMFVLTDKIGDTFIALAFATFIYSFAVLLCRRSELKFSEKHPVTCHVLVTLRKGLRIIYVLAIINIIMSIIGTTQTSLVYANNIINIITIISIGWIAIQILYTFEAVLYQQMMRPAKADHLRMQALYTKMHIIRNIATVAIIIITIAAILMSFSSVRNIGISLLASAGFLTAVVGLAAQKGLFSLFSGLQIALSQPIKIGDIVVIENATGIVEEITFTYVRLKLGDRRRLVVPINYFVEKAFENWSHEGESISSSLHIYLDYTIPIEPIRNELSRILHESKFWDGMPSKVQVTNLTERSVELRIQISAPNADNISDLRAEVHEKILEFVRKNYPDHFPKLRFTDNTTSVSVAPA